MNSLLKLTNFGNSIKYEYGNWIGYSPKKLISYDVLIQDRIFKIFLTNDLEVSTEFSNVTVDGTVLSESNIDNLLSILAPSSEGGLTPEQEAKLDNIITDGDGTKYLSDDGTYKTVSGDLSNYYTKSDVNSLLNTKQDKYTITYISEGGTYPTNPNIDDQVRITEDGTSTGEILQILEWTGFRWVSKGINPNFSFEVSHNYVSSGSSVTNYINPLPNIYETEGMYVLHGYYNRVNTPTPITVDACYRLMNYTEDGRYYAEHISLTDINYDFIMDGTFKTGLTNFSLTTDYIESVLHNDDLLDVTLKNLDIDNLTMSISRPTDNFILDSIISESPLYITVDAMTSININNVKLGHIATNNPIVIGSFEDVIIPELLTVSLSNIIEDTSVILSRQFLDSGDYSSTKAALALSCSNISFIDLTITDCLLSDAHLNFGPNTSFANCESITMSNITNATQSLLDNLLDYVISANGGMTSGTITLTNLPESPSQENIDAVQAAGITLEIN